MSSCGVRPNTPATLAATVNASVTVHGFSCQFGFERREWVTPRAADAAAVWQLFGTYPGRWFAVAGVRSLRRGRKPITWTPVDRDYETLRIDLQTLFTHLGITTTQAAAA